MLIVDDDDHVRRAIARVLGEHDVDQVDTAERARTLLIEHRYDAWVLDMFLGPDMTGLELLTWARTEDMVTPALLITGRGEVDRELTNQALFWDAFFAYKPLGGEQLKRFVARALSTSESVPSVARRYSRLRGLSPRETELVAAIASGVSRGDVAAYLGIEDETVKSMVKRIRTKTGVDNLGDLLRRLLVTVSGLDWDETLNERSHSESCVTEEAGEASRRTGVRVRAPRPREFARFARRS